MNCNSCSTLLPPGVAFCPSCGTPVPYNSTGQGQGASLYDPTIASASYNAPQSPSTGYGTPSNPYGYSQPQDPYHSTSSNPYDMGAPSPQSNLYEAPQNPPAGLPPYGYNPPSGYPPQGYPQGGALPGTYGTPSRPRGRSKIGMIIGITVLVLVLGCAGLTILGLRGSGRSTSTTPVLSDVPQSSAIDPAAKATIFNIQMASSIDKDYYPTNLANTFKPQQDVYMTFHVDSQGQDGYIKVNWYLNGQKQSSSILTHSAENDHGYFDNTYDQSGDGAVAAYWCLESSCSDAKLAQVVTFTVTGTSLVPTNSGSM